MAEERSYKALKAHAILFLIGGVFSLIGGGISLISGNFLYGFILIALAVPMLAVMNVIELLINLEQNTHESANYLRQILHGRDKKVKTSKVAPTGLICTKCNSEVQEGDVHCKNCKALLALDGALKRVKKK